MQIDILTIFPDFVSNLNNYGNIGKAIEKEIIKINVYNLRDYSNDKHGSVDDAPYGGGPGMVMKPQPFYYALEELGYLNSSENIILMTPQGEIFNQKMAQEFASCHKIMILCGHYEGVDERIRHIATKEVSIGDYILTGGELPALVVVDAVSRLIPGVLGDFDSALQDSFSENLLEYPQYTRPSSFKGMKVPDVLLSGNHAEIARWRRKEMLKRTLIKRPDLLVDEELKEEDKLLLEEVLKELGEEGKSGI